MVPHTQLWESQRARLPCTILNHPRPTPLPDIRNTGSMTLYMLYMLNTDTFLWNISPLQSGDCGYRAGRYGRLTTKSRKGRLVLTVVLGVACSAWASESGFWKRIN